MLKYAFFIHVQKIFQILAGAGLYLQELLTKTEWLIAKFLKTVCHLKLEITLL